MDLGFLYLVRKNNVDGAEALPIYIRREVSTNLH